MRNLSKQLQMLREARCKLQELLGTSKLYNVEGSLSYTINKEVNKMISNEMLIELQLRSSVTELCTRLDGYDVTKMEPIDYISSNDVVNKFVDLCLNKRVVATINLITGELVTVIPESE